jgi:CO/xanthine dehydrogenase Mo-binding subunit
MTGFLNEKEFSRKTFLKGGGALIVGFSMLGSLAGKAQAASSPFASNPLDQTQVDSWIVINADNTASIKTGGVLQGTGSETGLVMIAGEELNMDMSQVEFVNADTALTPDTGSKGASNTIKAGAGRGVRAASATAAQALLGLASTQLGVPVTSLTVKSGVVSGGGKSVTYGELLGGKLFNIQMPASYGIPASGTSSNGGLNSGQAPAKPVSQYTLVGTSPPRIDIPGIVAGTSTYIQNVRVPGMLHGRVVRPRGQMLYGFGAPIVSVDESSISHIRGARVVRRNDFLGVVAPHEYDAIQAASQLKVTWAAPPAVLPGNGDEFEGMRALDAAGKTVPTTLASSGNVDGALASAAHVVSGTFGWPTNSHCPIGPNCAVADVTSQGARILTWTQGVSQVQPVVASLLGLPQSAVRISSFASGGCYGTGAQFDDTTEAAAVMSQLAGAPVRVQLMRWDEIGWDNTAPGSLMDLRAGIDAKGNLIGLDFLQFYPLYGGSTLTTTAELVGKDLPPSARAGVNPPTPMYNIPNLRAIVKSIPLEGNWLKADWTRAGSRPLQPFAVEQVVDDLARAANMDPVAFRVQNVTQGTMHDPLLAVLEAVTKAANWQPRVAASQLSDANVVTGRGVAWSNSYTPSPAAVVADISVNKKTGKVTVEHVYQAFSTGLSVYPGGIQNQSDGGIVQMTSRLLVEQLRYTKTHVTSTDFVSYPILRFKDSPKVTSIVVQRTDAQPAGAGQEITVAPPAAIANAFFDATGVRMRTAPFTPARVRAALKAAGVA